MKTCNRPGEAVDAGNCAARRIGLDIWLVLVTVVLVTAAVLVGTPASAQLQCSRTYTVDADFDEGLLQNVNHDAPNSNQLQLNDRATPPPYIWVANSGRGTVARVDVNTGVVIGEYKTAPDQRPRNPSRTTVDLSGNVWVGNRDEGGSIGGVAHGSVVKIGVVLGGTRTNSAGVPDVNGEYLKPPFTYSTAVDRDGDGLIRTSKGLGNILAWSDPTDPTVGDVADAVDECIIIYKRVPRADAVRHVSIDANNDVWVGGYPFAVRDFLKLDGDDGSVLTTVSAASRGCGGYGGLVDGNGIIWSASLIESRLMRYDPGTGTTMCIPVTNSYGLAIDNNGFLWNAMWTSNRIMKVDPSGSIVAGYPKTWAGASNCRGVAVTSDNHIWVANSGANTVSRLDNNGVLQATVAVGTEPTGVAVDANGKVWVANLGSNNAMRIDPSTNMVDMTVSMGAGAAPYNYSDMTGRVAISATSQQGTWTTVLNSGAAGTSWGTISWNGLTPAGTDIEVQVRAADNQAALSSESFFDVFNGTSFCGGGVSGQYLEIRTTLSRDPGITDSPILYDLTAQLCDAAPPVPDVAPLAVITGECSASITTAPTATDNCAGVVTGTTTDPTTYSAQGTYTVTWTYDDGNGNTETQDQTVIVDDVTMPAITLAAASEIWPPDHTYHTFTVAQMVDAVSDNCSTTLSESDVRIYSATSDEAEDAPGGGDGATTADIVIASDCQSVQVRSERMGSGNGRAYRIHMKLDDGNGNVGTASYLIKVRKSESQAAVEDVAMYSVASSCPLPKYVPVASVMTGGYELLQNNPNPFSPSTTIGYTLGQAGDVLLTVYDMNSTLVATLVDRPQSAGEYSIRFDAGSLQSGIYIYRLQVNGSTLTGRMLLLR